MKKNSLFIFVFVLFLTSCTNSKQILKQPENDPNFIVIEKEARRGDAQQQYNLGLLYYSGSGDEIPINKAQAFIWLEKAAEQGIDNAQYSIGYMYENGIGITQNYSKAAEWYEKAAKQNLQEAEYRLGLFYFQGTGVKKDDKMAVQWLNKVYNDDGDSRAEQILMQLNR